MLDATPHALVVWAFDHHDVHPIPLAEHRKSRFKCFWLAAEKFPEDLAAQERNKARRCLGRDGGDDLLRTATEQGFRDVRMMAHVAARQRDMLPASNADPRVPEPSPGQSLAVSLAEQLDCGGTGLVRAHVEQERGLTI
jgi:hypothetical protein